MNKQLTIICIIGMLLAVGLSGCFEETKKTSTVESKTIYVDDSGGKNYTKIQDAINNSTDGDTIYVSSGHYNESLYINKSISLIGENKETTFIECDGRESITILADGVTIQDFTIQNTKEYVNSNIDYSTEFVLFFFTGILIKSSNNIISDNIIINNMDGISLLYSNNNTISDNIIINNSQSGVIFDYSSNNTISGNIINSSYYSISFSYSNNNTISGNTISNNGYGINFYFSCNNIISGNIIKNNSQSGIDFYYFSNNNTISRNTINNNGYNGIVIDYSYNNNISDNTISDNNISGIALQCSSNNTISDNIITNNRYSGIELYFSSSNSISSNIINTNNYIGIGLFNSSNNSISSNTINNNGYYYDINDVARIVIRIRDGIYVSSSNNNIFYHNNLINNTRNANDEGNNIWYNATLKEGNYWSDYHGTDANHDGIGDTPYNITGGHNQDLYPLMNPFTIKLQVLVVSKYLVDLTNLTWEWSNESYVIYVHEGEYFGISNSSGLVSKIPNFRIWNITDGSTLFKLVQIIDSTHVMVWWNESALKNVSLPNENPILISTNEQTFEPKYGNVLIDPRPSVSILIKIIN